MSQTPPQLFRQEALEHHARPEERGTLLHLEPAWARYTYRVILALGVTLGVGLALVDINDYARGPVLIQVQGLEEVSATAAGRVSRVLVTRGQWVKAGQPLVELHASAEKADYNRVAQEFQARLAAQMMDPLNAGTRQELASLRAQLELSQSRLAERVVKAPRDGQINELRARENQYLTAGEVVATLTQDGAEAWAVALVPGHYRPLLKPGLPLRLELTGFPYAYQQLEVASVSDELVGPAEVQRYLGPGLRDVVPLEGPQVVVKARLPSNTFQFDERTYSYYTGLPGSAWVKVRARNGWLTVLPVLELIGKHLG
jgi:multidrug efflux pump subunit AcrA (membrane-fusion protein)